MTIKGQLRIASIHLELTEDEILELMRATYDHNPQLNDKLRIAYYEAYAEEYERHTDR